MAANKNSGMDMQPEFDKSITKSPTVNYSKKHSAGEIQDEIRQAKVDSEINGQAHQPY